MGANLQIKETPLVVVRLKCVCSTALLPHSGYLSIMTWDYKRHLSHHLDNTIAILSGTRQIIKTQSLRKRNWQEGESPNF